MATDTQKTLPCPDCGKTVSRLAASCPHCGRPMEAAQLIEQTAKKYKLIQLIGFGICVVAVLLVAVSAACQSEVAVGLSCLLFGVGFIQFVVGRGLAWWHHG